MQKNISIIGGGLCGSLLAIRLAQRDYNVFLFEKRADMRTQSVQAGRSINLALSSRGIKALKEAGLEDVLMNQCIPMPGRMIHPLNGETMFQPYSGRSGEYINSVSRSGLNIALLNKVSEFKNISLNFNHNCVHVELDNGTASFKTENNKEIITIQSDVIIGTDGANSAIRKCMLEKSAELRFDFSQTYLSHGYKELTILPDKEGNFQLEKNALHIWPRGSFMIIALPNLDHSFTVTMFHPNDGLQGLNNLKTKIEIENFFMEYYPELFNYIPDLVEQFMLSKDSNLITIKCKPWQVNGKVLMMGDAAHAIVPFYGQGMNASFEDVNVFMEILDSQQYEGWNEFFRKFELARIDNTNAIADLAIDNFYEMRDFVDDKTFIKKRKLETLMEQRFENYFSKYSMVTFRPDLSYVEAMEKGRRQDKLLMDICEKGLDSTMSLEEIYYQLQTIK